MGNLEKIYGFYNSYLRQQNKYRLENVLGMMLISLMEDDKKQEYMKLFFRHNDSSNVDFNYATTLMRLNILAMFRETVSYSTFKIILSPSLKLFYDCLGR